MTQAVTEVEAAGLVAWTVEVDDPGELLTWLPAGQAFGFLRGGDGVVGWGEAVRLTTTDPAEVSAVLATRRPEVRALDSGKTLPMTSAHQVLVSGVLASGAPLSLHYRGGRPRGGPGMAWEINGTRGDVRVTAPMGHAQLAPLTLEGASGDETS